MLYPSKTKGSAIIVALFVVALVTMAAVAMLTRLQQDMRRVALNLNANQMDLYAQGSVAWARDVLITNWKAQQLQKIIDNTPIKSTAKKINNATVESTLYDAQGFFNLNNLIDNNYRDHFAHLIKTVMPNLTPSATQSIVLATTDWITSNTKTRQFDDYYAKLNPPYRAPHHLMASPSELRLVKGMTPELFMRLSPYLIALPVTTNININNAAEPVLASLSPSMTLDSAKAIVNSRQLTPFTTAQQFMKLEIVINNKISDNQITITSDYFLLKTQVLIGEQRSILYTLLHRDVKNSQVIISILWQSKGTL